MEASSKAVGPGRNKRFWNEDEDKCLIESLVALHNEGTFKAEGNFKPGYLQALEKKLHKRLPGCDLLARPHIESRMKTFKTHFQIVHEMLIGPKCSGFGWDVERKTVTAEKPVWEEYLKSHKEAAPFKTKSFPYYEDLCMVFGKDRATGRNAETPADVIEELEKEGGDDIDIDEEAFNSVDNTVGTDEVQSMSFLEASANPQRQPQTQSQSQGSFKKKRKNASNEEAYEALKESSQVLANVIEKAFARLSRAIGEEMIEKRSRLRDELQRTTTISTMERHRAALMIMKDDAMLSYFFSMPEEERDDWVRALILGDI